VTVRLPENYLERCCGIVGGRPFANNNIKEKFAGVVKAAATEPSLVSCGSNVLSFVNCILRNFDCIKVCRSGLWSYCHYSGSPPTNLPPPYQTPSTFEFQVSKETAVLRRWEGSKQKFGFIKRVDKGCITTVKDLES